VRLGVKPEINAVCAIMIAVVALAIVAASLLSKFHDLGRETKPAPALPVT
jgi:putrescine transport system permease protein